MKSAKLLKYARVNKRRQFSLLRLQAAKYSNNKPASERKALRLYRQ